MIRSLLLRSQRYAEAVPVLRRAASINPGHPDVHYKLYIALLRLKRTAEAERELTIFKRLEAGSLPNDPVANPDEDSPTKVRPSDSPPFEPGQQI